MASSILPAASMSFAESATLAVNEAMSMSKTRKSLEASVII